jgi:hypothetical protein
MATTTTHAGTTNDQDSYLADRAGGLSLAEQGQSEEYDRDVNDINNDRKAAVTKGVIPAESYDEAPGYDENRGVENHQIDESPYDNYPNGEQPHEERPS